MEWNDLQFTYRKSLVGNVLPTSVGRVNKSVGRVNKSKNELM